MPSRELRGTSGKKFFRNERFNRGVISTKDPLFEGSFRRLLNFKISNQNASIENREPYLTVPLYDFSNKEIKLSKEAFVFYLNDDTEHAYIFDLNQELVDNTANEIELETVTSEETSLVRVIDGDTIVIKEKRYRLAIIDTPELDDDAFMFSEDKNLGTAAKEFLESELEDVNFRVVQYDFLSEKKDQFGREIVFIIKGGENINLKLLEEGYALLFNMSSFDRQSVVLRVDELIFEEFKEAVESSYEKTHSPFNLFENSFSFEKIEKEKYFSKPKIYKIKKETDLKKGNIDGKETLFKRILETFEINEVEIKKDLEILNDENLRYEFVNKEHSIINGKYKNQYLNVFVNVYNVQGNHLYRGLLELTHTIEDRRTGLIETFFARTYDKPEMIVEFQDLVRYKPNILFGKSFIPESFMGEKANAKGINNPDVDAVLLNIELNQNLQRITSEEDNIVTKFFNGEGAILDDLESYKLTPFFKAPKILNSEKSNYMFRWDFVDLKKIDITNEEELKKSKPFFRTSWTKLKRFPTQEDNISTNEGRLKKIGTDLRNIRNAEDYYIIVERRIGDKIVINSEEDFDINTVGYGLGDKQLDFQEFIKDSTMNQIKERFTTFDDDLRLWFINNFQYEIRKVSNVNGLKSELNKNNKEDSLILEEGFELTSKEIKKNDMIEIFKEEKRIAFIFLPLEVYFKNGTEKDKRLMFAWQTEGIFFDNTSERKEIISYDFSFKELFKREFDFKSFFEKGIQATFYLTTYENVEDLTEMDEYYDLLAYKKSSPTYFFRRGNKFYYRMDHFIDEKMDRESLMIKYCNHIVSFEDKIIVYGNPSFKNSIFMSEEGAPYYFALSNVFEFDHEVVHVQVFKTIALAFTINDIWVIYPWEVRNEETGVVTRFFRMKKILYNISTEHKNKNSIKNITRYITLLSNDVLYLIKPSTYIIDETEFFLNILSKNVESIFKDPLSYINERLKYFNIQEEAIDYKMNLNATDNFIKVFFSTTVEDKSYTLILIYDVLNNRWIEEDTCSFGFPEQIYLLDSSTKYEMLTEHNHQLYITYQTDKYKNLLLDEDLNSYYDLNPFENFAINYFIDTGYMKLNEHLRKRFRELLINFKNVDSSKILFSNSFMIDDIQFDTNEEVEYKTNDANEFIEVKQMIQENISSIEGLKNFLLDFSHFNTGEIVTMKRSMLGLGRLPRVGMSFSSKNRFYLLSFGIIYTEHGGK